MSTTTSAASVDFIQSPAIRMHVRRAVRAQDGSRRSATETQTSDDFRNSSSPVSALNPTCSVNGIIRIGGSPTCGSNSANADAPSVISSMRCMALRSLDPAVSRSISLIASATLASGGKPSALVSARGSGASMPSCSTWAMDSCIPMAVAIDCRVVCRDARPWTKLRS